MFLILLKAAKEDAKEKEENPERPGQTECKVIIIVVVVVIVLVAIPCVHIYYHGDEDTFLSSIAMCEGSCHELSFDTSYVIFVHINSTVHCFN